MKGFLSVMDAAGKRAAVKASDIRILEDEGPVQDGSGLPRTTLTMCDGAQMTVIGDVADILKDIEALGAS